MKDKILSIFPTLLSFLYKSYCVCCKEISNSNICGSCLQDIYCNGHLPYKLWHNIEFYSAGKYSGNLRKAILALKFKKRIDVSYDLAKILGNYWKNLEVANTKFEVVPIPIHKTKKKIRGYDQTELIAKKFSFLSNNKYNPKLLIRTKETAPQFELSYKERKINLEQAFSVEKKHYYHLPVLLVDDICTTGTTIKEAIKALNTENIQNIVVLTISNVDLKNQSINIQ